MTAMPPARMWKRRGKTGETEEGKCVKKREKLENWDLFFIFLNLSQSGFGSWLTGSDLRMGKIHKVNIFKNLSEKTRPRIHRYYDSKYWNQKLDDTYFGS